MNSKEIIEITRNFNLHPNKMLGQNFLCNKNIIEKIIQAAKISKSDTVLEIGAGLGDLTEELSKSAKHVTAIEIDSGLIKFLEKKFEDISNVKLVHGNFLKTQLNDQYTASVSNLPYYCSSEILFILATKYRIPEIFVMLQKEMTERITSSHDTKNYGALTVALGLYYDVYPLFNIDRKSFYPQPEIQSSFIKFKSKKDPLLNDKETDLFHVIVKSAFWARRKTLLKTLSESPFIKINKALLKDIFEEAKIDLKIRGESLSVNDFIDLTKILRKNNVSIK